MGKNMEFWLKQDDGTSLRLPVIPGNYDITWANNNSSFFVEGKGEVSFLGKPKLTEIAPIESLFPNQNYTFCSYSNFPTPKDCVTIIKKMIDSGKPVRYIITTTPINILCSIESFNIKENDGTGDISFSLVLKEYVVLK